MIIRKNARSNIGFQMLFKFFEHISIYVFIVLAVSILGYFYGKSRVWYWETPGYPFLRFLHNHWLLLFFCSLFVGCLIIACLHIWRFAKNLVQITEAINDLSDKRVTYIKLPSHLTEVESELNQILVNMKENHQIAIEAERRKNDVIVYMAHDLKTPLTSVIGYLNLLHDEKEISTVTQEKYIQIALRKAERLEELINEFFEITKFNYSNKVLALTKINLSVMMEQLVCEFHPLFCERGVRFQTEIEKNIFVQCDVDKIERVFDNLLKNAYAYCYDNTDIYINMHTVFENKGVIIKIQNQGKHIPKEKIEYLFEQFFRMDHSRSSKTGGSGLGLAIAKEIVTLHHGTISCESENETITFTVYLPCQ